MYVWVHLGACDLCPSHVTLLLRQVQVHITPPFQQGEVSITWQNLQGLLQVHPFQTGQHNDTNGRT